MSCGVGHRGGSDLELHRPAATVPTRPLAWEPPYAVAATLKRQKDKKKNKKTNKQTKNLDKLKIQKENMKE